MCGLQIKMHFCASWLLPKGRRQVTYAVKSGICTVHVVECMSLCACVMPLCKPQDLDIGAESRVHFWLMTSLSLSVCGGGQGSHGVRREKNVKPNIS